MQVPCIIALPVMTDLRSDKGSFDQAGAKGGTGAQAMEREQKETIRMIDSTGFPVMAEAQSDDALTYQNAAKLEKGAGFLDEPTSIAAVDSTRVLVYENNNRRIQEFLVRYTPDPSYLRISVNFFNTREEIDRLVDSIKEIRKQ